MITWFENGDCFETTALAAIWCQLSIPTNQFLINQSMIFKKGPNKKKMNK